MSDSKVLMRPWTTSKHMPSHLPGFAGNQKEPAFKNQKESGEGFSREVAGSHWDDFRDVKSDPWEFGD